MQFVSIFILGAKTISVAYSLGVRRYRDVESTHLPLIQRCNNVVCPVGSRSQHSQQTHNVYSEPLFFYLTFFLEISYHE